MGLLTQNQFRRYSLAGRPGTLHRLRQILQTVTFMSHSPCVCVCVCVCVRDAESTVTLIFEIVMGPKVVTMLHGQVNDLILPSLHQAEKAPHSAGHRQDGPSVASPELLDVNVWGLPRPACARGRRSRSMAVRTRAQYHGFGNSFHDSQGFQGSSLALVTVDLHISLTTPQQRAVTRKVVSAAAGGRVQRSAVRHLHTPAVNLRSLISTPTARPRPFPPINKSLLASHVGAILKWGGLPEKGYRLVQSCQPALACRLAPQ